VTSVSKLYTTALKFKQFKININCLFQYFYKYHKNNTTVHACTYTACEQPVTGMIASNHYLFHYFLWKYNF